MTKNKRIHYLYRLYVKIKLYKITTIAFLTLARYTSVLFEKRENDVSRLFENGYSLIKNYQLQIFR
jgi:hypothetical protein